MITFTLNSKKITTDKNKSLLRFLRDDLHLTSVKDGCSQGACGTCTVIVNKEAKKACTIHLKELDNAEVITAEGLSEKEKEVYSYAFAECGAVQCGYCTPGMIMCAKALIDKNPNPTTDDIKHAIRNNICRCTGYVKIIEAISLASSIINGSKKIQKDNKKDYFIGSDVQRVDAKNKALGVGVYPDDIYLDGMLYVVAKRSDYPRAIVKNIDISVAEKESGVVKVITASDVPGKIKVGHLVKDWNAFIEVGKSTHFLGDTLALVVAKSEEEAREAVKKIKVDYEVLKTISSPEDAEKDTELVHPSLKTNLCSECHLKHGDPDLKIKNSDYVLTEEFETPFTEHAFLETECAVAHPYKGGVKIYSTDQGVYDTQHETAPLLNLPLEKVVVENCLVGGGFGGKEDVSVQHHVALAAFLTSSPCKMKLTREESLLFHPKRHPMKMKFTLGCNKDGKIQALKAEIKADTGAYASLCGPVLQRSCTHAAGPYNYQDIQIDGVAYYTNNTPSGAFRGFGVTQTNFAFESLLNKMADTIGISGWDIRFINAIRPGDTLPNGQIVGNDTALAETLLSVKDEYFSNKFVGIACGMKNAGVGVGIADWGRVKLIVNNGKVYVYCGGSCLGQGLQTVLKQIICTTSSLKEDDVITMPSNTETSPDSGTSSGSRHTTVTGEAARRASLLLKDALKNNTLSNLDGKEFIGEYLAETDPITSTKKNPKSHVAYGYATQVCILDEKTFKIKKIIASHDVGRIVNPKSLTGQIEGGVVMSMGYALSEKFDIKDSHPTKQYGSLGLLRSFEIPEIECIPVEKEGLDVSYGAKGVGEITSVPTASAIQNAYTKVDNQFRTVLPLKNTPYSEKEFNIKTLSKKLVVNPNKKCLSCHQCEIACSSTFAKTDKKSDALLRIDTDKDKPVVCVQCGKCMSVCKNGAISKTKDGVYIINSSKCTLCLECQKACPLSVIKVVNSKVLKCIACGKCASGCPIKLLNIVNP